MKLDEIRKQLRAAASAEKAAILQRFFKTGPGEYAEGDVFLGLTVPDVRRRVRQSDDVSLADVRELLRSRYHEERLLALLILVRRFERGDEKTQLAIYRLYLRSTRWINNWDLVDSSAPRIVGGWLLKHPAPLLEELVVSKSLWERRIAVLATAAFIAAGQFDLTLRLCRQLLGDKHDLMHKACGWMLREVGKRDPGVLREFLQRHVAEMPRTMLRYAIERFPEKERRAWLAR